MGSVLLCLACLPAVAFGSVFRGSSRATTATMSTEQLRATMLDELMAALGGSRVNGERLAKIEETLLPMFLAMPKNVFGNLEHASVRFLLHRLFVQRHGIYVRGLEPRGEAWSASSPTEILEDRVPSYVQSLFEERLSGRGLAMHELGILAATLEHLMHDQSMEALQSAWGVHRIDVDALIFHRQAEEIVDTYMLIYVLGKNASELRVDGAWQEGATWPSWPESQRFTRDVQSMVVEAQERASNIEFAAGRLSFNATAMVVEEIGERYGRWQDAECQDMKGALMKIADNSTGRVPLKNFYGHALDGAWQFTESVAYLKELGALDESGPQASVIIPNYVLSPSNCLTSASFFSVCCFNECEGLMGSLEREIKAPEASPARILELVEGLPSSTVEAPRRMSSELRKRLFEVAEHHGGTVQLYGRLFSQWLHYAFPNECPYPHLAGTTRPMSMDEWMGEGGPAGSASTQEMRHHAWKDSNGEVPSAVDHTASENATNETAFMLAKDPPFKHQLLWSSEEELVVAARGPARREDSALPRRFAAGFLMLASLWMSLSKLLAPRPGGSPLLPLAHKAKCS